MASRDAQPLISSSSEPWPPEQAFPMLTCDTEHRAFTLGLSVLALKMEMRVIPHSWGSFKIKWLTYAKDLYQDSHGV